GNRLAPSQLVVGMTTLWGMFSGKQIPAVGVSLGIERVFAIMEQQEKERNEII
ncbi:unnamed protein product, partial [Urochloa humidicola]